jgi:GAF domain-containing protein
MADWQQALERIVAELGADSGTIHVMGAPGLLHLRAATKNIPEPVIAAVREVPVGKGMAGLAVERGTPVDACNIQTDGSGDVRPGARATGLQGAIVVPMMRGGEAVGALGVANFRERTFTAEEIERLLEQGRALAVMTE